MRIEIPPEYKSEEKSSAGKASTVSKGRTTVADLLNENEYKLYEEFIQSIYDALIVTDINGSIIDANVRAEEFFRAELTELLQLTIFDAIRGFTKEVMAMVRSNLENDRFTLIEAYGLRRDGTTFPAEIASSIIHLKNISHFLFFIRDITKRKEDEAILKQTRAKLARAEKLETAGSIAGHIAHDFNNLLTPLLAYPDLIKESLDPNSQAYKDLELIQKTAQQMADINQQLLSLSRRAYYEQQPMNLNTVIEDLVELIKRAGVSQNIEIITQLSSDIPNIRGSPEQLLRVVQNLCQNAIDAMGDKGTLTIKTERVYLDRPLQHYEDMEPGEYVKLTVSDTGCGIPKEIWDKIFDPFFTTKKATKQRGSGLGLSVVHGIVKDHKGYIDFYSEVGKGTIFYIYFPVCYEGELRTYQKELARGEGTVMIIDDDALQTEVAGRILEKLGYTVLTANSSGQAFQIFKECQQKNAFPDLVILDMILNNDMDGAQIYEHIKQFNPAQKAIVISGYAESDKVDRAMALGAGAFLRKPVTAEKLSQAVQKELSRPTTQKLPRIVR